MKPRQKSILLKLGSWLSYQELVPRWIYLTMVMCTTMVPGLLLAIYQLMKATEEYIQ